MGGFFVEGFTLGQALREVVIGQGTALRLPFQSALDGFQRGLQIDAEGVFLQKAHGVRNRDRATAQGQHGGVLCILCHRLLQHLFLQTAETAFPIGLEDGGNGTAGFFDNGFVQIDEGAAQGIGEQAAYGTFPAAHESGQCYKHKSLYKSSTKIVKRVGRGKFGIPFGIM